MNFYIDVVTFTCNKITISMNFCIDVVALRESKKETCLSFCAIGMLVMADYRLVFMKMRQPILL